jgi:hypothetical protein
VNPAAPARPETGPQARWAVALGWFAVAGAVGVLLRAMLVRPFPALTYPFWLHAHSHVVLLGWAFNALLPALLRAFPLSHLRPYRRLWRVFQVAVLGMLVFFPVQGYAAGSIAFSTLHVFASYYLAGRLRADLRPDRGFVADLLRWGLLFLVLSTLGPYALGVLKARHLHETIWYNLAIYYYLHFLYNGWLVFGGLALLFRWLEGAGLVPAERTRRRFLRAFVASAFGTVCLSALWTHPPAWVWALGGASGLLQLAAGAWLVGWLWRHRRAFQAGECPQVAALLTLALLCFGLKLALQALSALPWAAQWAYAQRHLVVAYLHLVFIGVITFFLLGWAIRHGALRPSRVGLGLLVMGFVLSETALVAQSLVQAGGGSLPHFGGVLLGLSVGMWGGVLVLWGRQVAGRNRQRLVQH